MNQNRLKSSVRALIIAGVVAIPAGTAFAQTPADNTKVNTRDRAKGAVTADQQKENASDRELTQKIRRALMQDKTLSSYAHNVKIVAQGGQVTLKGPVRKRRREAERRGEGGRGRGRRARHEPDEHRPLQGIEEVTTRVESKTNKGVTDG